jgi:eukaryotic-like serine/threonine-protein kinase
MFLEWGAWLLSLAHDIFGPGVCPGDWVWATATAGALIALLPTLGALLMALVRKGTGNRYNGATIGVFATFGAVFAFFLPWVLALGSGEVFRTVFHGNGTVDLTPTELQSFATDYCWVGTQQKYLGGGANVYEVLFHPFESPGILLLRIVTLVGLPGLGLLFVWLQARAALRRGPKWPGRLFWLPFLLTILLSAPMSANAATFLWLGFVPVSVLGLIPVLVVGPPSWSTIERSNQRPQERVPPYQPEVPAYVPPPQPQQPRFPPPQRPPVREPEPDRAALAKLASDPGPLPFAAGGARTPHQQQPSGLWKPNGSGRFQRIRQLGHGGFGTVWLARDTQLDRTVAVKLAHAPDDETEERMLREARALAAVHHPNCVRVYDIVVEDEGLGIVMEYIEGDQLAESVSDNGPLGDVAAARLWLTMAGALTAAHGKNVLHRDVKPANVIIDPSGSPHLIDFGIARTKGDKTLTATGMMVGTPDYLAPETANGAAATPASDAWQLAATVSFTLTGHPPRGVRDSAMAALMAAAKAEPLSRLPQRSAHARLLAASLDTDPSRRPTLAAIAREMQTWLSHHGQVAEGPVTQIVDRERTRPIR